jgi:hypothetical protein
MQCLTWLAGELTSNAQRSAYEDEDEKYNFTSINAFKSRDADCVSDFKSDSVSSRIGGVSSPLA